MELLGANDEQQQWMKQRATEPLSLVAHVLRNERRELVKRAALCPRMDARSNHTDANVIVARVEMPEARRR
jgi:hypothetical protein